MVAKPANSINLNSANKGPVLWDGTSSLTSTALTDGQLLIGSTGNFPTLGTLTAGANVTITNAPGAITIAASSVTNYGFTSVNIQTFTSSGTYTPTAGMVYCQIQCLGGGGAGGGAPSTSASQYSTGGGGGAGEYAVGIFAAATIGASQTVTIGAGGTGNSGLVGGNGGNTSVGTLISAFGGTGGGIVAAYATNLAAAIPGSLGGTGGSGGNYRTPGNASFGSYNYGFVMWGKGADSQLGAGGNNGAFNTTGVAGLGYGSGGSPAANTTSQAAHTGGSGTPGIVIVTEYIASSTLTLALPWTNVTGTSQAMAVNNGYIANNAGLVTLTLPATAALGTLLAVSGLGAGGWKIAQNAGQYINFGSVVTTTGVTGYLASFNQFDTIFLLCTTANTSWSVLQVQGNITYN